MNALFFARRYQNLAALAVHAGFRPASNASSRHFQ
jgi:hypothetical protein